MFTIFRAHRNSQPDGDAARFGQEELQENGEEADADGSIPHNSPCQAGGMASDSILCAGGTSSFAQAVIAPLLNVSIFRHPTKVKSGS